MITCSGTSFAAPAAVGVAALLLQALPGLATDPDELEHRLKLTGTPVTDDFDPQNVRTTPRVDARVALLTDDNADYDSDGLTNGEEFDVYGSNPLNADTDADGMPDGFEVGCLNLLVADGQDDADSDTVLNLWEFLVSKDPCTADAGDDDDGDGLPNEVEVTVFGTNPAVFDTDLDSCSDGQEIGPNEGAGGDRDPLYFWDFMDQWVWDGAAERFTRDGGIVTNDISALVARFGTVHATPLPPVEDLVIEALATPENPTDYHASADRAGADPMGDPWDLRPPDGDIVTNDISALVGQFGHSCA